MLSNIMKNLILILFFTSTITNCNKTEETPLMLPEAAEPSAKIHNDRGIKYFQKGKYLEALIAFTQANVADSTAGEIFFNLGLAEYMKGNKEKAKGFFEKALHFAKDNERILESKLIKKYLDP